MTFKWHFSISNYSTQRFLWSTKEMRSQTTRPRVIKTIKRGRLMQLLAVVYIVVALFICSRLTYKCSDWWPQSCDATGHFSDIIGELSVAGRQWQRKVAPCCRRAAVNTAASFTMCVFQECALCTFPLALLRLCHLLCVFTPVNVLLSGWWWGVSEC